jgi:hypothetical protein
MGSAITAETLILSGMQTFPRGERAREKKEQKPQREVGVWAEASAWSN